LSELRLWKSTSGCGRQQGAKRDTPSTDIPSRPCIADRAPHRREVQAVGFFPFRHKPFRYGGAWHGRPPKRGRRAHARQPARVHSSTHDFTGSLRVLASHNQTPAVISHNQTPADPHQRAGPPEPRMRRQGVAWRRQPQGVGRGNDWFLPWVGSKPRRGDTETVGGVSAGPPSSAAILPPFSGLAGQVSTRMSSVARRVPDLGLAPPGYGLSPLRGWSAHRTHPYTHTQETPTFRAPMSGVIAGRIPLTCPHEEEATVRDDWQAALGARRPSR
jgi:hypothetical protein